MSATQPTKVFANMFVVGVTGHRDIGDPETVTRLAQEAGAYFAILCSQHDEVCVLSQLAVGADTILVERAIAQGLHHVVVEPFARFEEDFTGADLDHYHELRAMALETHTIDHTHRSDQAYLDAGRWIVEQSHVILAAWDGQDAQGPGGTGDIVAYAQEMKKPVLILNTPR